MRQQAGKNLQRALQLSVSKLIFKYEQPITGGSIEAYAGYDPFPKLEITSGEDKAIVGPDYIRLNVSVQAKYARK